MTDPQRTLVLLKPDAVRRGLVGTILARYEAKGLTIVAAEHRRIDAAAADRHYADHVQQPWYPPLREYIISGPLVALVLQGPEAIEVVRLLNGATNGVVAAPGTVRATSRCRTGRTWSTPPTLQTPRPTRSRSGFPRWADRDRSHPLQAA